MAPLIRAVIGDSDVAVALYAHCPASINETAKAYTPELPNYYAKCLVSYASAVKAIRQDSQVPIVFYVYFNLLHRHGFKKFIEDAARAGVDGLLVLDLPPEESGNYEAMMREAEARARDWDKVEED